MSKGTLRTLVLAPASPFPPHDGVAIRVTEFLRRITEFAVERERTPEFHVVTFGDAVGSHFGASPVGASPVGAGLLTAPGHGRAPEAPHREALPFPHSGSLLRASRPVHRRLPPLAQSLYGRPTTLATFRSPEYAELVRNEWEKRPDMVLAVGLQMAQFLSPRVTGCPVLLDDFNVEWRVLQRLAALKSGPRRIYWTWEAEKLRRCESGLLRSADVVLAVSETDRTELRRLSPQSRVEVVGPSLPPEAEAEVRMPGADPKIPCLVFTGAMNWHVNVEAASWFVDSVLPALRVRVGPVRVYLVGKDPSPAVRALGRWADVTVTGSVPDVRPYLRQATVAIVPLRYGSGVRYKILEAFAAGAPVVSTSVGCEGLGTTDGQELLVADDPVRFAEACAGLIQRESRRREVVARAAGFLRDMNAASARAFHEVLTELVK